MPRQQLLEEFDGGWVNDPNLKLYLPLRFSDGNNIYSKDRYNYQFTNNNSIWTPQGRKFDGVDDSIYNTGDVTPFNLTNNFTIAIWFKAFTLQSDFIRMLSKPHNTWDIPYVMYSIGLWNDNKFFFEGTVSGSRTQDFGPVAIANKWYFIAAVYPDEFYIDGQSSFTITDRGVLDTSTAKLTIGRSDINNGVSINGLIDEVMVFNRKLTGIEINNIYAQTRLWH